MIDRFVNCHSVDIILSKAKMAGRHNKRRKTVKEEPSTASMPVFSPGEVIDLTGEDD